MINNKTILEDTDHIFDYAKVEWNGPEGYTIVVPANDTNVMASAELLQKYYKNIGFELMIKTDNEPETEKEILVGKTSRKESSKKLSEANIRVSLKGAKLAIEGGHYVTVDSAVKKLIRLSPEANYIYEFDIYTDFTSIKPGGYVYVWGDEFEGDGLDTNKWSFIPKMGGSEEVEICTDKDIIDVNEGRLKLHAVSEIDEKTGKRKYRIPCSVVSQEKMNYVYGYVEVRSRVPYKTGCWPSFWLQSTAELSGKRNKAYMVEVDVYEIFRTNEDHSTIHKWYEAEFDFNKRYCPERQHGVEVSRRTTQCVDDTNNKYVFEQTPELTYEYHTYGYEWTPTEIKMSVDGKVHLVFDITKSFDEYPDMDGFHDPQFFIFNNHIFRHDISIASKSIETSPESLPACHYIDYIRLYQKPDEGKLYIAD